MMKMMMIIVYDDDVHDNDHDFFCKDGDVSDDNDGDYIYF